MIWCRGVLAASSIHSAEESDDWYWTVFWYCLPVVLLVSAIDHVPGCDWLILTESESPGATESGTVVGAAGSSSIQVLYTVSPGSDNLGLGAGLNQIVLGDAANANPGRVRGSLPALSASTWGTCQVPVTEVNGPLVVL